MYRLIPTRVLRRTIAANIDKTLSCDVSKINTHINDLNQKDKEYLLSDNIGTLEMFNNQYYLDYKEFKQKAAYERFLRGKDFVEKN